MKLKNTKTNQVTKIKNDEIVGLDLNGATDVLVKRIMPGHFAIGMHYFEKALLENINSVDFEIDLEICRACGELTEHTGKTISLTIID